MKRVTHRDIAKAVGCHPSTVSLALRGDPRLLAATRERIKREAEKMGFQPDPMLTALAAYRATKSPMVNHGTLAWFSNASESMWKKDYAFENYLRGAQRRAGDLGFRIEEFLLRSPGMNPKRLVSVLRNRGISGVLVAPQPMNSMPARLRIDWSSFSAVAFGYTLVWPRLHLVTNHHMSTTRTALRKLKALGYRRIGFFFDRETNNRTNGGFYAGFAAEMERWPPAMRLLPFGAETANSFDEKALREWFHDQRPDALILLSSLHIERVLQTLGVRTPEDIGIVSLSDSSRGYAVVEQCGLEIGASAVEMVVGMMHTNQRGIPEIPRRILIEGRWREGYSVRRIHPDESRTAHR